MTRLLSLARAAHLVGVSRGVLQKMLRAGELAASDGFIAIDELHRVFPQAAIEDSGFLERVVQIREESFGRRVRERMLPSQEVLAQRLFVQSQELADLRRYLRAYHELVTSIRARVTELSAGDARLRELSALVDDGLKRVLGGESASRLDAIATMLDVIAAHVTVQPSGRQFVVEGNDSILQAGLKAGAQFSYGCGTGTCGLCKARVISGEVRQIQHADYPLSEQERQQGHVLLCTHTPVTDVVVETLEARGPQDIPAQDLVAKVRAVSPLGRDTLLLHLQTPRSSRLRFLAGQSVTLGMGTANGDVEATVPLASCPCDERNLHFHIARDADNGMACELFAGRVRAGDAINVRGPVGSFVLDADSGRPLVFAACDTGFAPIKSLIEHAMANDHSEALGLYWLAAQPDGNYLANQCRAWVAAFDQFHYEPLLHEDPAVGGAHLVESAAQRHVLADCDIYVAGPGSFVAAATSAFIQSGAQAQRVFSVVL